MSPFDKEWIKLNVGGRHFVTTRSTLCTKEPTCMLARMFSRAHQSPSLQDEHGAYLIDRSPTYFEPILGYLRHGKLIVDHNINLDGVREEAKFYNIASLIPILDEEIERYNLRQTQKLSLLSSNYDSRILNQSGLNNSNNNNSPNDHNNNSNNTDDPPLTRRDVVRALMSTPAGAQLRLQGLNLAGANLSKLDLRCVNLKYANLRCACLRGADLSQADLERADLSQANLEGVRLIGANLRHTNLENANMRAITIELQHLNLPNSYHHQHYNLDHIYHHQNNNQLVDTLAPSSLTIAASSSTLPFHTGAQFECANMKSCNLEGSQMAYANLRRATLNNANLQNCNLQGACLTGANFENCDLTGSNLIEANLRNANFKGAQLSETAIQ